MFCRGSHDPNIHLGPGGKLAMIVASPTPTKSAFCLITGPPAKDENSLGELKNGNCNRPSFRWNLIKSVDPKDPTSRMSAEIQSEDPGTTPRPTRDLSLSVSFHDSSSVFVWQDLFVSEEDAVPVIRL